MKTIGQKPLVSIIMPVKDTDRFITVAVKSILKQTYTQWELIAVDDGSKDTTGKILDKFAKKDARIKVIHHKSPQGIAASLNEALAKAKGSLIARMDGDDVMLPHRLRLQIDYLAAHPQVVAVGGQAEMIDGEGEVFALKRFPTNIKKLRDMIMWVVPIQHPIMMARAKAYKRCQYDRYLSTAEDVDLFMQLLQYGEFGNVPEIVYQYRKSDMSNGYHNVKRTFWLTMYGRIRGIVWYGYKPSVKGVILSTLQFLLVPILPSKWIVRMYEARRFNWVRRTVNAFLSWLLAPAKLPTRK